MLECQIALCRRFGVPADQIPQPMTPFTDSYLDDLCHLAEIDLAERERAKKEAENQ